MFEGSDESFLLSAVRTPMGKFQGSLATIPAPKLGAIVVKEAVERAGVKNKAEIDEVIMGNVVSAGLGQNPARQAAIFAGLPSSVGATTINKVCGSGLKSVMLAAQAIHAGDGSLYVAGGMESMSRAPFLVEGRNNELRFGHGRLIDALLNDGLWDPFENWAMGDSAEFIAKEYQVTREAMDEFALASQMKAIQAIDAGKFKAEIVPVEVPAGKGQTKLFDTDETPRRDTSQEILSKLKPSFQKDGRVTAGNAPGLNDGAAALVVASASKARSLNAEPLARIIGYAQVAVEPRYLFIAPAKVIPLLLDKVGWTMSDVDLIELNEAFAVQSLTCLRQLGIDEERVNVHGGALAIGHPLGATGAIRSATVVHALRRHKKKYGMVTMCVGMGQGAAGIFEAV